MLERGAIIAHNYPNRFVVFLDEREGCISLLLDGA